MKKKIFVGNLSWKVTDEVLKPVFEAYGNVISVKIIVDQYTGKSKGYGFVEMESPEHAERAIQELNDKPLLERNLRVSLAQERTDRYAGSSSGGHREYRGSGRDSGQRSY